LPSSSRSAFLPDFLSAKTLRHPAFYNTLDLDAEASGGGEVETGVHVEAESPVDLLIWTLPHDGL
jgi:hypothetical protein